MFRVCFEGLQRQLIYIIDESCDTDERSNTIVIMLNHFFAEIGLEEAHLNLHTNNCDGQNKNNTMLHYHFCRVMVGRYRSMVLSFVVVGHKKFK